MARNPTRLSVAVIAAWFLAGGCREAREHSAPEPASRPAVATTEPIAPPTTEPAPVTPASQPATTPAPEPPTVLPPHPGAQAGWLRIVAIQDGVDGGWATGDVDPQSNKIVIQTHNVSEFAIDTRGMGVRWDRMVVLRINRQSMELTRKKVPTVRFRQTPTGDWDVVRD